MRSVLNGGAGKPLALFLALGVFASLFADADPEKEGKTPVYKHPDGAYTCTLPPTCVHVKYDKPSRMDVFDEKSKKPQWFINLVTSPKATYKDLDDCLKKSLEAHWSKPQPTKTEKRQIAGRPAVVGWAASKPSGGYQAAQVVAVIEGPEHWYFIFFNCPKADLEKYEKPVFEAFLAGFQV